MSFKKTDTPAAHRVELHGVTYDLFSASITYGGDGPTFAVVIGPIDDRQLDALKAESEAGEPLSLGILGEQKQLRRFDARRVEGTTARISGAVADESIFKMQPRGRS
jgi:hypothetical protein